MGNVNYPKVTIVHGPEHGDIFKISNAFGLLPPLDIVSFTDTFPHDNPHAPFEAVMGRVIESDYLLLQSDTAHLSLSLTGGIASSLTAHEGYGGYVGYFDQQYNRASDPWWHTR